MLMVNVLRDYMNANVLSAGEKAEGFPVIYYDIHAPDYSDSFALRMHELKDRIIVYRVYGLVDEKAKEIGLMTNDLGLGLMTLTDLNGNFIGENSFNPRGREDMVSIEVSKAMQRVLEDAFEPEETLAWRGVVRIPPEIIEEA